MHILLDVAMQEHVYQSAEKSLLTHAWGGLAPSYTAICSTFSFEFHILLRF